MRFHADKSAINSLEPPVIINTYGTGVHVTQTKPQNCRQWIEYFQKMKPQTNAMSAGLVLMIFNGIHLGWGIFNNHLRGQPWAAGEDEGLVFWSIASWFIAAIVGFFLTALLVKRTSKTTLYITASVLVGLSSLLFIMYAIFIIPVMIARVLAGLSYGIVYITLIVHGCEVAVPKLRGFAITMIHFCLFVGVLISSSTLVQVYSILSYDYNPNTVIGILGIIFTIQAVILQLVVARESPIYLLQHGQEQEALDVMVRLRSESQESWAIRNELDETKRMLFEDAQSTSNIFSGKNLKPLLIVLLLKLTFVVSFNMPLNLIWLENAEIKFYDGINDTSGVYLSTVRMLLIAASVYYVDGRKKKLMITSTSVSGCILIAVAIFYSRIDEFFGSPAFISMTFLFQFFAGTGIGLISDIYSSEAFNTTKKPLSIAFTSTIEFLLQIFLIAMHFYMEEYNFELLTVSCCIMLLISGFVTYYLPDTSNTSLREARNLFRAL